MGGCYRPNWVRTSIQLKQLFKGCSGTGSHFLVVGLRCSHLYSKCFYTVLTVYLHFHFISQLNEKFLCLPMVVITVPAKKKEELMSQRLVLLDEFPEGFTPSRIAITTCCRRKKKKTSLSMK